MPQNQLLTAVVVAALLPLAAWAQGPGIPASGGPADAPTDAKGAPDGPPTEAEKQLDEAIAKVAALKSVSADVTQSVDMLEQKFQVTGRYLKAPNHRILLNLKVGGLADTTGTMLQICDGQTLWDYQQILDSQSYRKVEVGQIFEKLGSPELDDDIREQVVAQLGFAGPEQLLEGLRRTVKFDQKESGTLDGVPVWILRGTWKSPDGLLGPNQQPLPVTATLPPYVPSLAVLTVGQEDGWPYKVDLVGKVPTILIDNRPRGQDGRPLGTLASIKTASPTKIALVYDNVKLNPDLKLEEFVFQAPPGARVDDGTQMIVNGLEQMIQTRAAQKKAEAAKVEGPLLDQTIPIPTPSSDVAPAPEPADPVDSK